MYLGDVLFRKRWTIGLLSLEFGYNIFNRIKFSSFIVVMFVLLSIIEALPGGTYSLVLLKY